VAAPRVAVVGGGIAGLFLAHALLARGIEVTVHEQARALGEIGAGVFLTPNGIRQLRSVGLGDEVARRGARVTDRSRYHRHDGAEIAGVQLTDSAGTTAALGMHRADLVALLAEPLPDGVVSVGRRATSLEQDADGARVGFADGSGVEADVVVAADGIHSELRHHVVPPAEPVFSGSVAYRGLVPADRVPEWPRDEWNMWLGPGRHFLVFPVRAGELINYVAFVPADEEMRESWSAPGDPDELRREFADWDPRIGSLLAEVDATLRWGLYDREPLSRWTEGRLTLLGDAAHPMLPHLGQGANQAMEDGSALAALLARTDRADAAGVRDALGAYDRLRRDRVASVQRGARENGMRYDSVTRDLAARDAEMVAHARYRRRLYDYDVLAEVGALAS